VRAEFQDIEDIGSITVAAYIETLQRHSTHHVPVRHEVGHRQCKGLSLFELNGSNEHYQHRPDHHHQRCASNSGPKAVGPVLRVAKHFRPIDHRKLHDNGSACRLRQEVLLACLHEEGSSPNQKRRSRCATAPARSADGEPQAARWCGPRYFRSMRRIGRVARPSC
jgi:hypothetical protein